MRKLTILFLLLPCGRLFFIWLRQVRGELREWSMDPARAMAETIDTDDIAAHSANNLMDLIYKR
jgi:hypothetical protein